MKILKCSIVIFFIPLSLLAWSKDEKVEKKIIREFNIQSNGRLELYNKYGNMDIAIGQSDKIKIDITIAVTSGSEKRAKEALNNITVNFEESTNRVSAATKFEAESGWRSWFNTGKVSMDIHYQVLVPADIYLDLNNRFGSIYLETTNRDLSVELAYGDLRLGDVNGKLSLDMAYSEGRISQILDGSLVLAYSELEMEDGNDVSMDIKNSEVISGTFQKSKISSAFSDIHSLAIKEMDFDGKYDEVLVEQVQKIMAKSSFTDISVQELTGKGNFDMRYGQLNVLNIQRGFSAIDINTSYTSVVLEFKQETSFSIDAETNYCKISHSGLKVSENIAKGITNRLKASRGSGSGKVYVRMNYGELKIE